MKKRIPLISCLFLSLASLSSCTLIGTSNDNDYKKPNSDAEIVEITSSYTDVRDNVYNSCFGVKNDVSSSSYKVGSCVCIKKDDDYSYFLTNRHVVEAKIESELSSDVSIYFGDGYLKKAKILFATTNSQRNSNECDDLAVLRISTPSSYEINPVTFSTDIISKGISVVSIGCPISLNNYNTITVGSISKVLESSNLLMHSATINPGNSGGGLFNLKSELVGLNVSRTEETSSGSLVQNMCYAISLDNIMSFLDKNDFEL